tara:strand:+ start:8642 stop:9694 length:1053 start_codon:yes stop_codon:yes gene_type:complete
MPLEAIVKTDEILERINHHPELSLMVRRQSYRRILQEEQRASTLVEIPARDRRESSIVRPKLRRHQEAWNYVIQNGINMKVLENLGFILEPEENVEVGFRKIGVMIGKYFALSSFDNIPRKMHEFYEFLQDTDVHPILLAIGAHIGMVREHPYRDGNGRAARILEAFILRQANYTPPIIMANEKAEYMEKMTATLGNRFSRSSSLLEPTPTEQKLHKFIAERVLRSMRNLETELENRRMYRVSFETWGAEQEQFGRITQRYVRRQHQRRRTAPTVMIDDENNSIGLTGNLSQSDVENFFSRYEKILGPVTVESVDTYADLPIQTLPRLGGRTAEERRKDTESIHTMYNGK